MHKNPSRELSEYRINRAFELVADAENLFATGSYKSANNRAYYAIFHAMRAVLALDNEDFKKHSGVIQYFQKNYIKTEKFDKEYSNIITTATTVRNASDYDDFYIASREATEQQIADAKKFCEAVKDFIEM